MISRKKSLLLLAVAMLTGCSTTKQDFGCQLVDGVRCLSLRQVHSQSHEGQPLSTNNQKSAVKQPPPKTTTNHNIKPTPLGVVTSAKPLRSDAVVMSIWVAPWQDANGDLMMAGRLYTEIEPRKWLIGLPAEQPRKTLFPLGELPTPKGDGLPTLSCGASRAWCFLF